MGIYRFKISQANYIDDDKLVEPLKATSDKKKEKQIKNTSKVKEG